MDKNRTIFIAGGILIAFAAGLLLGRGIDRGEAEMRDSAGRSLVSPSARERSDQPRRPFQMFRGDDAPRAERETSKEFAFDRLILETNGSAPRACVQFTRELDASGKTNYADYVRLTPALKPAVSVAGQSLCLSGIEFDKEYKARVRAGTPSKSGEKLKRPVEVTIAFGDKPAYVGFVGDGVILPRLEADGLGIETVNVEKINISVYRVSDRSLARKSIAQGEASPEGDYFYVWDQESGEDVGVKVFDKDLTVKKVENDTVTTVFPLGAALPDLKPGAYFVRLTDQTPGGDKYRKAQAWRWVMFTDLAMTTYSSGEGIDVFVRSIDTGRPLSGVELELVAARVLLQLLHRRAHNLSVDIRPFKGLFAQLLAHHDGEGHFRQVVHSQVVQGPTPKQLHGGVHVVAPEPLAVADAYGFHLTHFHFDFISLQRAHKGSA